MANETHDQRATDQQATNVATAALAYANAAGKSRALERAEQELLGAVEMLIGKALMVRIPAEFQTEVKP